MVCPFIIPFALSDKTLSALKTLSAGSAEETCPANIGQKNTEAIQSCAEKAFKALKLKNYARFDFLMDGETNEFYCLEANTLPGMTPTSLVPQEAAAVGISFNELCEKIISISLKNMGDR